MFASDGGIFGVVVEESSESVDIATHSIFVHFTVSRQEKRVARIHNKGPS